MSDCWSDASSSSIFHVCDSEGSGKTARMRRLAWAFAGRLCDKYQNLMSWLNSWGNVYLQRVVGSHVSDLERLENNSNIHVFTAVQNYLTNLEPSQLSRSDTTGHLQQASSDYQQADLGFLTCKVYGAPTYIE